MGTPIPFEHLFNVRDLGGMTASDGRTVRKGLLFRGGQLFSASESDIRQLGEANVRTVVDFRSIGEHEEKPDPTINGVKNVFLPIIEDVGVGVVRGSEGNMRILQLFQSGTSIEPAFVEEHMRKMYRMFVEDSFANAQYARFIDEVVATAASGGATYWHCTAGKDRAGFAAAILLMALDVPRETIVADYLQTNECISDVVGELMALFVRDLPSGESRRALERFFVADEDYLGAAFDAIADTCGSADAYLAERLHVDKAKQQKLQDLLLED